MIVLVEGVSDKAAVEALARRRGLDLGAQGISVVSIGGSRSVNRTLRRLNSNQPAMKLAGLCDSAEQSMFRVALERADPSAKLYVCEADLEEELIRAMGPDRVEEVVAQLGELNSFRSFQKQPAQRGRPVAAQLRRFLGTHSGRKALYARALVEAAEESAIPSPLDRLVNDLLGGWKP